MVRKVSPQGTVDIDYDFFADFRMEDYENWLRGIVHSVIKQFNKNTRFDFDELMSEAYLALCEKAQQFNPEYNNSLLGFAKPYIYQRLYEFISTNMYTFKVRYYNIRNDQDKLDKVNHMESSTFAPHKGTKDKNNGWHDTSDTTHMSPLDSAPSGMMDIDDAVELNESCKIMRDLVNNGLKNRERRIVVRRHRDNESFQEIGEKLKISKETARRIYHQAMKKLAKQAKEAGL